MSIAPIPSAATPAVPMASPSSARFQRAPAPAPAAETSIAAQRMSAVAELIERVTGRTVEFVPPMPYLTSGPVGFTPVSLEVVGRTERLPQRRPPEERTGTVQVDVTDVIDRGTSSRMLLTVDDGGALSLHPELRVKL